MAYTHAQCSLYTIKRALAVLWLLLLVHQQVQQNKLLIELKQLLQVHLNCRWVEGWNLVRMTETLVVDQLRKLPERMVTSSTCAGIHTLLGMHLDMCSERIMSCKSLVTHVARIWTFSSVAADVGHDLVALGKWTALARAACPSTHVGALATGHMVLHDMANECFHGGVDGVEAHSPLTGMHRHVGGGGWRGGRGHVAASSGAAHFIQHPVHFNNGVKVIRRPIQVC